MKPSPSFLRKLSDSWALSALCGLALLGLGGCGQNNPPMPVAVASPTPTPIPSPTPASASVTPNSFAEVTAQLEPGGDLYLYLSTADWLGHLSQSIDNLHTLAQSNPGAQSPQADQAFALLKDAIKKSGIEQMTGFGASSLNYSPGLYRNKLFIHHYAAQGSGLIWSLYGNALHSLPGVDFLPLNTALAGIGDFDLAGLLNFVRQEINQSGTPQLQQGLTQWQSQFYGLTGLQVDDVLASLNGEAGMVLELDGSNKLIIPAANGQTQTIPYPHLAVLLAVKNDLIFKQVDKLLGGTPGIERIDTPGLSMRTMQVPVAPFFTMIATMAQWNGYLVLATDNKVVQEMDATLKGAPGFKSTEEYKLLSAGLPQQGNGFGVATDRFSQVETQLISQGSQGNLSTSLAQHFQHPGHFMGVSTVLPNGLLTINQGSQGSSRLIPPLIIAPAAALGAFFYAYPTALRGIHSRAFTAPSPSAGPPANPPPIPAGSP